MTLKCQCCGFEKEFADGEEAFQAGWDAPPHFSGYVACDLCPGSFVVLGMTDQHSAAHEKWKREGRPAEFEPPDV
jgi:hypothetical protein